VNSLSSIAKQHHESLIAGSDHLAAAASEHTVAAAAVVNEYATAAAAMNGVTSGLYTAVSTENSQDTSRYVVE